MHIDYIVVSVNTIMGSKRQAIAGVIVKDELGNTVSGADVTGDWSGCDSSLTNVSGITDVSGLAKIQGPTISNQKCAHLNCRFAFAVSNITNTGMTYDPDANVGGFATASAMCAA